MSSVVAPAFPFYAFDWLSSSTRAMSLAARGAYVDLLAFAWDQDGLPADTEALRRMTGASVEEWAIIWPELSAKFAVAPDGRRRNPRLEAVRRRAKAQSARGVRGGRARAASAQRAPGGLFVAASAPTCADQRTSVQPASEPASDQPASQRPASVTSSVQPASHPASHQPRVRAEDQDLKTKIQHHNQDQDPGLTAGPPVCGNVENPTRHSRGPVRAVDVGQPNPRQIAHVAADIVMRDASLLESLSDLTEDTKRACARMRLPYDAGAVRKGIDVMLHQRARTRGGGWSQLSACTG